MDLDHDGSHYLLRCPAVSSLCLHKICIFVSTRRLHQVLLSWSIQHFPNLITAGNLCHQPVLSSNLLEKECRQSCSLYFVYQAPTFYEKNVPPAPAGLQWWKLKSDAPPLPDPKTFFNGSKEYDGYGWRYDSSYVANDYTFSKAFTIRLTPVHFEICTTC